MSTNFINDIIIDYSLPPESQNYSEIEENSLDSSISKNIFNSSYGFNQNSSIDDFNMVYKGELEEKIEHDVNKLYFIEKSQDKKENKEETTKFTNKDTKLFPQNEKELLSTEKKASLLNKKNVH